MFGFDTGAFSLAIVAILAVFVAMMLFVVGQTIHRSLQSRKSAETGKVSNAVAVTGGERQAQSEPSPSTEASPTVPEKQKSYDDDFDDIEFNLK